jgi:hypothetical protein
MSFISDLISPQTAAQVRSSFLGFMQGAGLKASNWRITSFIFQMSEACIEALRVYTQAVPQIVRGYISLADATDPGDPDPNDAANAARPAAPGFLSDLGANTYSTTRGAATFAAGEWTFINAGPGAQTFRPGDLIFTWTGGSPPNPPPTYTNTADATVYTNPDGTATVAAGASLTIPIEAQIIGSIASAPGGTITLTTTLTGVTGTNANAVTGADREDAATYRVNCQRAMARLSLAGPAAAYEYLASKTIDGAILYNQATPPAPVGITRVQMAFDIATGIGRAYYASASGPALAADVAAANANIQTQACAVPGCVTFVGAAASQNTLTVTGSARIKARGGITSAALAKAAAEGIVAALDRYSSIIPIGGLDQNGLGVGIVYADDFQAVAASGYPGLYDVGLTVPATDQGIGAGNVVTVYSIAGDGLGSGNWVITVVP